MSKYFSTNQAIIVLTKEKILNHRLKFYLLQTKFFKNLKEKVNSYLNLKVKLDDFKRYYQKLKYLKPDFDFEWHYSNIDLIDIPKLDNNFFIW